MTEEEKGVYLWFVTNLPKMVDFYSTLHIFNLVNILSWAKHGKRHTLIPDDWPIESAWSLELLVASVGGVMKNNDKQEEWENWIKN